MNIEEKVYEAIVNDTEKRTPGIHVSDLVYDCMRKAVYGKKYGSSFNLNTELIFWIGRAIHKTPILKHHELSLEVDGVSGTVDEYEDGILIDKKTCRQLPTSPNLHHVKQLEYYAYMLSKNGKPVNKAYIVYIDVAKPAIRVLQARMRPIASIEQEFKEKVSKLKEAENGKLPKREQGWICNYCSFATKCWKNEE